MKKMISESFARNGLLVLFSLFCLFHLLVLLGVIPFDIVWGGRLTNRQEMLQMESVSLLLNLLMLAVVAVRAGRLPVRIPAKVITVILWLMVGLFALNTLGNLFSLNGFERAVFTPVTLLLSLFCLRLALEGASPAAPPLSAKRAKRL
ncbi:hypothetical protein V9K67_26565 [Paraflavisolibacter sp. H34]|uniref:hypothetical protein n=1 Tax=Huijunlia imazamoxiresistens TaxID=3127457 RepID=UPI0030179009